MNNKEQLIQQLIKHELRRSKPYNSQLKIDKEYLSKFEKYTEEKLSELCQIYTEEEEERKRDEQLEWERRELREYYQPPLPGDIVVQYSKLSLWELEEAVALVLGILPKLVRWDRIKHHHNGIHNLPVPNEFYISWIEEYYELMILIQRAVQAGELRVNTEKSKPGLHSSYFFKPIDFIQWAQKKEIPLPTEMERLVKKYTKDCVDLEARCNSLQSRNEELQVENGRLKTQIDELENDKPNTKSLNYYKQLAMGTLALLYEDKVALWRKWANSTLPDKVKDDLKFTEIQNKLESLNAKGITIKRDAISSKIKESISLLAPK